MEPDTADGEYDTTAGGNPNMTATEIRTGRNGYGGAKFASTLNFDLAAIPPSATVPATRIQPKTRRAVVNPSRVRTPSSRKRSLR